MAHNQPGAATARTWVDSSDDEDIDSDTRTLLSHENRIGKNQSYQALERRAVNDHNDGLDRLGEAIKRQKYMVNELATEVDLHHEILDDIDNGVSNTNENIRKSTRNIKLLSRKSSTCFLGFIIILLDVVIVTLAII